MSLYFVCIYMCRVASLFCWYLKKTFSILKDDYVGKKGATVGQVSQWLLNNDYYDKNHKIKPAVSNSGHEWLIMITMLYCPKKMMFIPEFI